MRDIEILPFQFSVKRSGGFISTFVPSAKHHSAAVSSTKATTINGAGWSINDTPAAFRMEVVFPGGM
ncbi:hypothetical protein NKJ93_24765 [Mesorhizobium sp. M0028]|uniref:hypothetical protein n=1 Tax=Mesorhizobium sp. M0028 TaxID=2956849 RepID=UPI003334DC4D